MQYQSTAILIYVRKIFLISNNSDPLIRTRTCAYQGVRNVSFTENFAYYVLNEWSHTQIDSSHTHVPLYPSAFHDTVAFAPEY